MNRRLFLRFLGLAPAAAVATQLPPPTVGPWRMVEWFEKGFQDGSVGFCAEFLNSVTGERARQAVRAYHAGWGHETRHRAKGILEIWGADLNRDPAFAAEAVLAYGDILEGYEGFRV